MRLLVTVTNCFFYSKLDAQSQQLNHFMDYGCFSVEV